MKKWDLYITSISTSMPWFVSILSHKLNVSFYHYSMFFTSFFSVSERHSFSKSTYFSYISLPDIFLLSSSSPTHGYILSDPSFSFFNVFTNCAQSTSADWNLKYLWRFCCKAPEFLETFLGLNITVSKELFVTSKVAEFLTNVTYTISVFCYFLSYILTVNNSYISSLNYAFIFITLCSLGFSITCPFV